MHEFTPHGHCILWDTTLLITMVIANLAIFLSYFSIPYNLIRLGISDDAKQHLKENLGIILWFATFIVFCGLTHLSDIITMWFPYWYMDATIRVLCAMASVVTAIKLPSFIKRELSRPSEEEIKKLKEECQELSKRLKEMTK